MLKFIGVDTVVDGEDHILLRGCRYMEGGNHHTSGSTRVYILLLQEVGMLWTLWYELDGVADQMMNHPL